MSSNSHSAQDQETFNGEANVPKTKATYGAASPIKHYDEMA